MKTNWIAKLGLPIILVIGQGAMAADKSLSDIQSDLVQQIRVALSKQDLHTKGALNPFPIVDSSGLVKVEDEPVFTGDGGGQNGTFADVNKKSKTLEIRFSNTWVHALSQVYCLKSAVTQQTNSQSPYFMITKGQENQCIEIAAVSRDLSLDSLIDYGLVPSKSNITPGGLNYDTTPEYSADLSVLGGKLNIKVTSGGKFKEAIYIWNRSLIKDANSIDSVMDQIEKETMTPVAAIDQGAISKKPLLLAFQDVEWLAYQVPSLRTNVETARSALADLSPSARPNGEKILDQIAKYQAIKADQDAAADKNGLYGTTEFKAFSAACQELWLKSFSYDQKPECKTLRKLNEDLFQKRRSDATYTKLETEMQTAFPVVESAINPLIGQAEADPSIVTFLIDIQPSAK